MFQSFLSHIPPIDTADTTRILGMDPIEFNTYVTKVVYPSAKVGWRPNAVILVPFTTYHYGLVASPIIHFPTNAPILFVNPCSLSPEILIEIMRLSPTGNNVSAKVIIVGRVSPMIEVQLKNMGLSTVRIGGTDPVLTAAEALEFRYKYPPESMEGLENIMIASAEDYTECIHAAYFSAHMGVPILLTYRDSLPDATKSKLQKYSEKNVFVIGSERTIAKDVLSEIRSIVKGKTDRIGGSTPYECAVNFSKYFSTQGNFGWNINEKDGWSFCFGIVNDWAQNISACIFAHLGKHSPLLYVEPNRVSEVTKEYILSLKPVEQMHHMPPFMHGFILGYFDRISHKVQVELEEVLIKGTGDKH